MMQSTMFHAPAGVDRNDNDSYCTPPEVMGPVHMVARVIHLDPWTNGHAIAHGWVKARTAWTLEDGRHPHRGVDPRAWPLRPHDFAWGNCPYSGPGDKDTPYVHRFIHEVKAANAWGMLLLKTDNRTGWWAALEAEAPFLIMWKGAISFFKAGERQSGNNFASTIVVLDYTGTPATQRYGQLTTAFADVAWVHM